MFFQFPAESSICNVNENNGLMELEIDYKNTFLNDTNSNTIIFPWNSAEDNTAVKNNCADVLMPSTESHQFIYIKNNSSNQSIADEQLCTSNIVENYLSSPKTSVDNEESFQKKHFSETIEFTDQFKDLQFTEENTCPKINSNINCTETKELINMSVTKTSGEEVSNLDIAVNKKSSLINIKQESLNLNPLCDITNVHNKSPSTSAQSIGQFLCWPDNNLLNQKNKKRVPNKIKTPSVISGSKWQEIVEMKENEKRKKKMKRKN